MAAWQPVIALPSFNKSGNSTYLSKSALAEIRAMDANQPVAFESELFTELRPEHRDGTVDALPIFYLRGDGRKLERRYATA
jgi:hypothetical protein